MDVQMKHWQSRSGFTLAELLIALTILGVIATFTIPKILVAQKNSQYIASTKEAISMLSAAYEAHQLKGLVTSSTTLGDLTQYMNYVSVDTSSIIDDIPPVGTDNCATQNCLLLHSGGKLFYGGPTFGGTGTTNYLWAVFDPDGKVSSFKGVSIDILYNGRVATEGALTGTTVCNSWGCDTPTAGYDPSWFNW